MGNVHPPGSGHRATEGMEVSNEGSANVSIDDTEKDNSDSRHTNFDAQIEPNVLNDLRLSKDRDVSPTIPTGSNRTEQTIIDSNQIAQMEHDSDGGNEIPDENVVSNHALVAPTDAMSPLEQKHDTEGSQDVAVSNNKAIDPRPPTLLTYQFSHLLCAVGKRGISVSLKLQDGFILIVE
jgi:hypothetical protein